MKTRIDWVRENCHLLNAIGEEFGVTQPFAGRTIGAGSIAEALLLPIGEALARCTCDAQDEVNHVFLIVDMGSAHCGSVNRARGLRRFSKREVRA